MRLGLSEKLCRAVRINKNPCALARVFPESSFRRAGRRRAGEQQRAQGADAACPTRAECAKDVGGPRARAGAARWLRKRCVTPSFAPVHRAHRRPPESWRSSGSPRDPARIAHERHGGRHDGARRARDAPLAMIRARQRRRVLSAHVDTRDAVFDEARGGRTENT